MTFSSDSSCADDQVPRDRAIHLCVRRDVGGRELLGRSDAEGDVTVREVVGGGD